MNSGIKLRSIWLVHRNRLIAYATQEKMYICNIEPSINNVFEEQPNRLKFFNRQTLRKMLPGSAFNYRIHEFCVMKNDRK